MNEPKLHTEAENAIANKLVNDKIGFKELDLSGSQDFNAALCALERRNLLAKKLNPANKQEKELILAWLNSKSPKTDYNQALSNISRKISCLDEKAIFSEQSHDNEIIKFYLNAIIKNKDSIPDFKIYRSFDQNIVMKINFETMGGEEIVYLDKVLGVPVYMLARADISFKIIDAYAFLKFADINIQQITIELIMAKLDPIITKSLRTAMLGVINENNLCYYDLKKYYVQISRRLKDELEKNIKNSGMEITNAYILNTNIPSEIDKIFENQQIELTQRERNIDLQHKAELLALDNYEKKAAIHSKYPDFEPGLTEKEKDNAVDRYLTKARGERKENLELAKDVSVSDRDNRLGKINDIQGVLTDKLSIEGKSFALEIIGILAGIALAIIGCIKLPDFLGFALLALTFVAFGISIASIVNKKNILKEEANAQRIDINSDMNGGNEI